MALKKFKNLPAYIVENHNEVVPFIYRCIGSKYLPLYGNVLIHFDSHPDLLIPHSMNSEVVYNKFELFDYLSIENWIMPAAYAGHISTIIWLKPKWANQISDGQYTFYVGSDSTSHEIRVTSNENYFLSDSLFVPESELNNKKEVILIIKTLDSSKIKLDDVSKLMKSLTENHSFVLDIDLDFFSTRNPFLDIYHNCNLYERLKSLYKFEAPSDKNDDFLLTQCVQNRQKQIKELEDIFKYLDDHDTLNNYPKFSKYLQEVKNIETEIRQFYIEIDWLLIHDMGCTCDDSGLPHHVSSREEVQNYVKTFSNLLRDFSKTPTVITISRSSEDDYCPSEDVEFIQDLVISSLKDQYQDIHFEMKYLDDSK